MKYTLLFYERDEFHDYKEYRSNLGYTITTITEFISDNSLAEQHDPYTEIIDISALTGYLNIQLLAEQTLNLLDEKTIFIADKKHEELLKYELRLLLRECRNIEKIPFKKLEVADSRTAISIGSKLHKKIVDLENSELEIFFSKFNNSLCGHGKFKNDFEELIRSFRIFNKLGEHKILSLFLMGESGVGKTEVARTIYNCLGGEKHLAKVNFGNYSNEYSLSSLIGSARGYMGSDDGEIFIRIRETDVGVLLIDEFEKSNATLFNYFLDVLESGKIISSMAEEINLDGFIIIFTSNIRKENFEKFISPELRSRFDYKGLFTILSRKDKEKYAEFRIKKIIRNLSIDYNYKFPDNFNQILLELIDVSKFNNMRDINKRIKKEFTRYLRDLNIS